MPLFLKLIREAPLHQSNHAAQIDAVVALAMAVERAEVRPAPVKLVGWV